MQSNRPIVLLQSGHEVVASQPLHHARRIAFCTFLRHFLGLAWLWTTVFFFSLLERHGRCLVMCSYSVGTGKSSDLRDFQPCRSRQSLAITPGQLYWPELRKGDIQEEKSISCWRKKLVQARNLIIKCENGATSVCLQVWVPREQSSKQAVCIDSGLATCIATERLPELQKSIQTKKAHHFQNRQMNPTVVYLFFIPPHLKKRRKTTAGLRWSHPGLKDICARAQGWAVFVAKDFGIAKLLAVLIGLALILKRQPKFYWDMYS